MFNSLNDLYLQFIEIESRIRSLKTKIILLPNLFGPREPSNGVIPSIVKKVINGEKLVLAKAKRDFIFVDSVISYAFETLFRADLYNDQHTFYFVYTSGKEMFLVEMYDIICRVLGKCTEVSFVEEPYKLIRAKIESSKILNVVIEQNYSTSIECYRSLR